MLGRFVNTCGIRHSGTRKDSTPRRTNDVDVVSDLSGSSWQYGGWLVFGYRVYTYTGRDSGQLRQYSYPSIDHVPSVGHLRFLPNSCSIATKFNIHHLLLLLVFSGRLYVPVGDLKGCSNYAKREVTSIS